MHSNSEELHKLETGNNKCDSVENNCFVLMVL